MGQEGNEVRGKEGDNSGEVLGRRTNQSATDPFSYALDLVVCTALGVDMFDCVSTRVVLG